MGKGLGKRIEDAGAVYMRIRQMTSRQDRSKSAYVHLPAGTPFLSHWPYSVPWAVENRGKMNTESVWLTQDGWIYQDWQVLLPFASFNAGKCVKRGDDSIWRYTYGNETYPLLCRPVNWAELELLYTFR